MIQPQPSRGDVVAYDFRRPSRISPDRQRNLEATHEQLAQQLQRWISGRLRAPFEVHLESISQASYGDFVDNLPDPGATFLYDIQGTPGDLMALHVDTAMAFVLIERLVGGNQVTESPDRALTPLEQVITRIIVDRVVEEVSGVWKDHSELNFEFARFESARELVEMAGRDDDILVTTLRVGFEEVKGHILVALPLTVLEQFLGPTRRRAVNPQRRTPHEAAVEKGRIEGLVRRATVVVAARLPETRMTLAEVAGLKEGDFLTTEALVTDAVEVHVSGALKYRGVQGKLGPHIGVQVTTPAIGN